MTRNLDRLLAVTQKDVAGHGARGTLALASEDREEPGRLGQVDFGVELLLHFAGVTPMRLRVAPQSRIALL
eukprot:4844907-Pyramimonas_sp.AAC.1